MLPELFPELEVERAVIGSVLRDPRLVDEVRVHLAPDSFGDSRLRSLYRLIIDLDERKPKSCDVVSVAHEIEARNAIDEFGDREFLAELMQAVPSGAYLQSHIDLVRQASRTRKAYSALQTAIAKTQSGDLSPEDALAFLALEHQNILRASSPTLPKKLSDVDAKFREELLSRRTLSSIPGLVPTPFPGLNALLEGHGLGAGQLVVVAARTGVGKTVFAMDLAEFAAQEGTVLFASLEMGATELLKRFYIRRCGGSGANLARAYGSTVNRALEETAEASQEMRAFQLHILEAPSLSMGEIRGHAFALKATNGLRLVVVDYLQLVSTPSKSKTQTRAEQVAQATRAAKVMAKELGCPVVVLAQLNRALEHREDSRPVLSDLRESGSIEQDADVVVMLHREQANLASEGDCDSAFVRKNRHGEVGSIPLRFNAHRQTWRR